MQTRRRPEVGMVQTWWAEISWGFVGVAVLTFALAVGIARHELATGRDADGNSTGDLGGMWEVMLFAVPVAGLSAWLMLCGLLSKHVGCLVTAALVLGALTVVLPWALFMHASPCSACGR